MKSTIKGQKTHSTGDIKLAATLMSVGIPLDQNDPAKLVIKQEGGQYASFHLMPRSIDGTEDTTLLMTYWSNPSKAPKGHPIKALMAFIADAPREVHTADQWLEFAHQWLSQLNQRPPDAPRKIEEIPDFVARHGDDLAGYVFSFAFNRDTCWREYLKAKESPDYLLTKGKAFTKVNHSTPKRISNELITRLNG